MNKQLPLLILVLTILYSCASEQQLQADVIYINGNIWTVSDEQKTVSAVAVKDGKVIGTGTVESMDPYKSEQTVIFDLEGKFMMPGFIEGHGHFLGFGNSLLKLNFLDSKLFRWFQKRRMNYLKVPG
jgi:predicted amidohydrolase YtcJ